MSTPQEIVAEKMDGYDVESSSSDDIAQDIAADPSLNAVLTAEQRRLLVLGLFDGNTTEGEEDSAMTILRQASDDDLRWIVQQIGWGTLASELDDEDIAELLVRTLDFSQFDYASSSADDVAVHVASSPSLGNLTRAHKLLLVRALFDGPTGSEQEDAAFTILMSMDPADLRWALSELGWSALEGELGASQLAELFARAADYSTLDPEDDDADEIAMQAADNPAVLANISTDDRIRLVKALFDGPTGEDEEVAALKIILSEPTGEGLQALACNIGWSELVDELDSSAIDQITKALSDRLDALDAPLLEAVFWVYWPFSLYHSGSGPSVEDEIKGLSQTRLQAIIDVIVSRRNATLWKLKSLRRRGKVTKAKDLVQVLDWIAGLTSYKHAAIVQHRHEIAYIDAIAQSIADADYGQLVTIVPDLVDGSLPDEQRIALFEAFRQLELELSAQKTAIEKLGDPAQKALVMRFTNVHRAFIMAFLPTAAPSSLLDRILDELKRAGEVITGGLGDLRAAMGTLAKDVLGALSLAKILGTADDDAARELIGLLSSQQQNGVNPLALIPVKVKLALVNECLSGHTGDQDEDAILLVFEATRDESRAETYQLFHAVGMDQLDESVNGEQWDKLLATLCGASTASARSRLVVIAEGVHGRNELFRDRATTRVLSRDEVCDAILAGKYPGYYVRNVRRMRIPVAKPDDRTDNNLG